MKREPARIQSAASVLLSIMLSSVIVAMAGISPMTAGTDVDGADLAVSSVDVAGELEEGAQATITATIAGDGPSGYAWVKRGIVLDIGGAGEGKVVMAPSVIKQPDGSYVMFYCGCDAAGVYRIFRADSPDGVAWTKRGVVYDATALHVNAMYSHVFATPTGYSMWYTGGTNPQMVYSANSTDGYRFTFTRLEIAPGGADAPTSVQYPFVIRHGREYSVFYQGVNAGGAPPRWICHADRSGWSAPLQKDGIVLTTPYQGCGRPWVLETQTGYEMYYTVNGADGKWRISKALSVDGLSWTSAGVMVEPTLSYEGGYTGACCVLDDGGSYRMWYTAWDGTNIRICLAEWAPASPGEDASATVSFYLDSISDSSLIARQEGVAVPAGSTVQVSAQWTAVPGWHAVIATVSGANPADPNPANDQQSAQVWVEAAPAAPSGPVLGIGKVKLSGIDAGTTLTYYEWELLVTVSNEGGAPMEGVVVYDVLPAELELLSFNASRGVVSTDKPLARVPSPILGLTTKGVFALELPAIDSACVGVRDTRTSGSAFPAPSPTAAPKPPALLPVKSTHIYWTVGSLAPGESETLLLHICTRVNPGGNQEFTSPGTYSLNDGAWAEGWDPASGTVLSAGPTDPITVLIA